MLSSDNYVVLGLATILALITTAVIEKSFPRYGEILGTQMVFPLLVIIFALIIEAMSFWGKLILTKADSKKIKKKRQKVKA